MRGSARAHPRDRGDVHDRIALQIVDGESAERLRDVRELFAEYWSSFGFTPCFQQFDRELAGLPGAYSRPGGRLAVAIVDGTAAGCIALRRIDREACEMKRLYVRPAFRGTGLGSALVRRLVAEARSIGYAILFADTMPVMTRALEMYRRMGFEEIAPYAEDATPGAVYLRLRLRPG